MARYVRHTGQRFELVDETLVPGVYPNLPIGDYHGDPAISKSFLDTVHFDGPARAAWKRGRERKSTASLISGSLAHDVTLLAGDRLEETLSKEYFVWSGADRRTKEGKAEWREAAGAADWEFDDKGKVVKTGKTPIDTFLWDSVRWMRDAMFSHPIAGHVLRNASRTECSYVREVPGHPGMLEKVRPDLEVDEHRMLVDIKTADDVEPDAFAKSVENFRYDCQPAVYAPVVQHHRGFEIDSFYWIAVKRPAKFIDDLGVAHPVPIDESDVRIYGLDFTHNPMHAYRYACARAEIEADIEAWAAWNADAESFCRRMALERGERGIEELPSANWNRPGRKVVADESTFIHPTEL